ncbi:DUF4129 domain-containing protein [Sphingobacterium arenae]|uniref:DUF4129 domain-containing protein n=1 Tax=Sphingobacterium arenae TaxID=1280598 RepID=A0ABR7Y7Y5_9SPHI|nr:DUF4129 domain-containing protein [Sphingobacterium arenae]MBD1427418.1 DUF4129 domain-containing protein [Sphingobacterium arenae]
MKRYKILERRKMGSRLFFVMFVMSFISISHGQETDTMETLSPPLPEDSISMKAPEYAPPDWIDYMQDGYYDTIPRMSQIPQVDTATYTKLIGRYQGEEFDYDKNSPNRIGLFKKILNRLGRMLDNLFPASEYFQFADLVYKVLAVVALVIFLWIIYRVLFSGKRLLTKDKDDEDVSAEIKFVEKNLLDIDLASFIDKAQKEGDFALAIRYLNLMNIQLLAKRELIHWKHTKTHVELIEEIESEELKKDFGRNVNIYNRVWYGNLPVDKAKYEEYASYFLTFQSKWR